MRKLLPKNGRLPTITPKSINDSRALGNELAAIRGRGYSIEQGEIVRGLNCFGVAVRTPHRKDGLIGISFSYPEQPANSVPPKVGG